MSTTPEEIERLHGKIIWEDEKYRIRQRTENGILTIVAHHKSDNGKVENIPLGYLLGHNMLQLDQ